MPNKYWSPRQLEDFNLWEKWHKTRRRDDFVPLVQKMEPLISRKAGRYSTVQNIPKSAVRAEFKLQAIKALKKYDPKYNVPLSHHVMRQMDAANRFVHKYQNIGRIPEHRIMGIGSFKATYSDLEASLKRPPTSHELADKLQWPLGDVEKLTKELRDDLLPWKGGGVESAFERMPQREREVLSLLPYELTPDEQSIFEFTYGYGGKPQLGTSEMAKALKVSPAKISRTKAAIAKKAERYLNE